MSHQNVKKSRFLSLVLRHEPEAIGITLDAHGWVEVSVLLEAMARHNSPLTREELNQLVRESDKQRFALSEDGQRIRANQGHSVKVDLALTPQTPPEILYHGTVDRFLESIQATGLRKGERHHVHLSAKVETALQVGNRRGKATILEIRAGDMHRAGHPFFLSENGVWLVDQVPPEFIVRRETSDTLFEGRFLRLKKRGRWEYVERCNTSGIIAILALTDQREILLVEQFRAPVNRRVIEIPAGLAGDIAGEEDEELANAAKRELREETGYEADEMEVLMEGPPSAGLSTEIVTFYRARGLRKIGAGGGEDGEDIQVHLIPLAGLEPWLAAKRQEGCLVDYKIHAVLYFEAKP